MAPLGGRRSRSARWRRPLSRVPAVCGPLPLPRSPEVAAGACPSRAEAARHLGGRCPLSRVPAVCGPLPPPGRPRLLVGERHRWPGRRRRFGACPSRAEAARHLGGRCPLSRVPAVCGPLPPPGRPRLLVGERHRWPGRRRRFGACPSRAEAARHLGGRCPLSRVPAVCGPLPPPGRPRLLVGERHRWPGRRVGSVPARPAPRPPATSADAPNGQLPHRRPSAHPLTTVKQFALTLSKLALILLRSSHQIGHTYQQQRRITCSAECSPPPAPS